MKHTSKTLKEGAYYVSVAELADLIAKTKKDSHNTTLCKNLLSFIALIDSDVLIEINLNNPSKPLEFNNINKGYLGENLIKAYVKDYNNNKVVNSSVKGQYDVTTSKINKTFNLKVAKIEIKAMLKSNSYPTLEFDQSNLKHLLVMTSKLIALVSLNDYPPFEDIEMHTDLFKLDNGKKNSVRLIFNSDLANLKKNNIGFKILMEF